MALVDEARFKKLKISGSLPTPKGVALEVISLAQQDNVSNHDIARLISSDPALSVRVIKAANVLLGNTSRPIAGISDAVTVLGMRALRQLVLGIALMLDYRKGPCKQFDYGKFWVHSLLTGIAARHLAQRTHMVAPEEIFVVGLLSRIGRLAMATMHRDAYSDLIEQKLSLDGLCQAEMEQFGYQELELSEAILADMNFPKVFQMLVREYVHPDQANVIEGSRDWRLVYLLSVASLMAHVCLAEPEQRVKLVTRLRHQAARVAIEAADLIELGLACAQDWESWSSLLSMGQLQIPSFEELLKQADETEHDQTREIKSLGKGSNFVSRVLVVDDDRAMLALLTAMLKSTGHTVYVARNGVEAMAQVEKHKPQLIITDWMMPEMDGLTLCRKLRERPEWRDIYMIVMTAQEDPDKLVEAFEAGADDYLVKPIIQKIFFSRLRAGLRVVKLQEELAADREQLLRLSTDLAEANEGLQLLALTDALTALPNRRAAMERVEQEWALTKRGNRNFSCMMVDVDFFKSINDRFGHPVGDLVLKKVASVLRQVARAQDMVCRYGGEEFLVICPDTDVVEGSLCAERLRQSVMACQVQSGVHNIKVTVSIGLAERVAGMSSLEEVLSLSDQRLYMAKQTGRNKVVFK